MKNLLILGALALSLTACAKPAATPPAAESSAAAPSIEGLPAGDYVTDPAHSSLTFEVSHMGFSNYTARFAAFDAHLKLDPAHPETASVSAKIDPKTLVLNSPPKGFHDELMGKMFFDAATYPTITFISTKVELTGPNTAKVMGDLTLHGVTKPVTMEAVFNGGYAGFEMDPNARIGFSLKGTLKRSEFGMGYGIPPKGTRLGVFDDVAFQIESEMTGPAWHKPAAAQ